MASLVFVLVIAYILAIALAMSTTINVLGVNSDEALYEARLYVVWADRTRVLLANTHNVVEVNSMNSAFSLLKNITEESRRIAVIEYDGHVFIQAGNKMINVSRLPPSLSECPDLEGVRRLLSLRTQWVIMEPARQGLPIKRKLLIGGENATLVYEVEAVAYEELTPYIAALLVSVLLAVAAETVESRAPGVTGLVAGTIARYLSTTALVSSGLSTLALLIGDQKLVASLTPLNITVVLAAILLLASLQIYDMIAVREEEYHTRKPRAAPLTLNIGTLVAIAFAFIILYYAARITALTLILAAVWAQYEPQGVKEVLSYLTALLAPLVGLERPGQRRSAITPSLHTRFTIVAAASMPPLATITVHLQYRTPVKGLELAALQALVLVVALAAATHETMLLNHFKNHLHRIGQRGILRNLLKTATVVAAAIMVWLFRSRLTTLSKPLSKLLSILLSALTVLVNAAASMLHEPLSTLILLLLYAIAILAALSKQ